MTGSTLVYDPTAPMPDADGPKRRALDGLAGKVVGFIDNSKPNFNHLVDDIAEFLQAKHGVKAVVKHRKRAASIPAPAEVMNDIVEKCDLVITGSGD